MFKFTLNDKSYSLSDKTSTKEQRKVFKEKALDLLLQLEDLAKENNINFALMLHTEDENEDKISCYNQFTGDIGILMWLMEHMQQEIDREIFEMSIFDNNE